MNKMKFLKSKLILSICTTGLLLVGCDAVPNVSGIDSNSKNVEADASAYDATAKIKNAIANEAKDAFNGEKFTSPFNFTYGAGNYPGNWKSDFEVSETIQEYVKNISTTVSASGEYQGVKGSLEYNSSTQLSKKSKSVYAYYYDYRPTHEVKATNPSLKSGIKKGGMSRSAFRKKYGTSYISHAIFGKQLLVAITMTNTSSETISTKDMKAELEYKMEGNNAKASYSQSSSIKNFLSNCKINIAVQTSKGIDPGAYFDDDNTASLNCNEFNFYKVIVSMRNAMEKGENDVIKRHYTHYDAHDDVTGLSFYDVKKKLRYTNIYRGMWLNLVSSNPNSGTKLEYYRNKLTDKLATFEQYATHFTLSNITNPTTSGTYSSAEKYWGFHQLFQFDRAYQERLIKAEYKTDKSGWYNYKYVRFYQRSDTLKDQYKKLYNHSIYVDYYRGGGHLGRARVSSTKWKRSGYHRLGRADGANPSWKLVAE